MWKPLRESSEAAAAGQSSQRATHKSTRRTNLLPLSKNKHSQVGQRNVYLELQQKLVLLYKGQILTPYMCLGFYRL